MKPHLSIIIVNWNTKDLLSQCLHSIQQYTSISHEIIISDNGSTDGSQVMLKKQFPSVKLIENNANLGFSKGNNVGINQSRGDFILLLNSDTKLESDALTQLVSFMQKNPHIGICGPKLRNQDGSLQPSAGYLPNLLGISSQQCFPLHTIPLLKNFLPVLKVTAPKFYAQSHHVGWVSGACFLIRREVLDRLTGLDEAIFMYMEEVEFCKRAHDAGWQVWLNPEISIFHLERGSSVSGKKGAILGVYRGLFHYYRKHEPWWKLLILHLLLKTGALLRIIRSPQLYLQALTIS